MIKKIFLIIFTLFIILLLSSSPVSALTWTKYEKNPVLDIGLGSSWDNTHVSNPAVLFDGKNYKMWYGGYGSLNGVNAWRIGYATSPDGINWTKYEGNPVLEPDPELDDKEVHVTEPTVLFNGKSYEMWFASELKTGSRWRIGYATSPDGINWERHEDPYFVLTASEDWEAEGVATPFVLKDGDLYKMWYAARAGGIWRIGYATSNDGVVWNKHLNNPVLTATKPWEGDVVVGPSVIKAETLYHVWYHAGLDSSHDPKLPLVIDYAYSENGTDWTKPPPENPALERGPAGSFDHSLIVGPSVIKRGDVYQMWYGGYDGAHWRIGYAATGEVPPPEKQPIILLPGFGASWNYQKIFLGQDVPQSKWQMTPFVKHYDNLINTLDAADYTKNKDLFVFNYDWTKPIDQIAQDLNNYIDNIVDPPGGESSGKKIKLIGHSLGGLIARTYIQNNPAIHQVDQLITLGSPHKGAVQVYQAWEGADLHDLLPEPLRVGAEFILALRWRGYKNKVETIRNVVPSLKDLLFIEDYLKKHPKGNIIPETSYHQQNAWLKNLPITEELKNLLNAVTGKTDDTLRWFKVASRSTIDKMLGRWEDGRPVGKEFEIGDKTILASSAGPEQTMVTEVALDHSDMVRTKNGISTILALLGLDEVSPIVNPYPPDTPYLVFALASPGNLRIINPLKQMAGFDVLPPTIPHAFYLTEEKMVVIPGAIDGNYQIEVVGNEETGAYKVIVGQLTETGDVWRELDGVIAPSETDTFTVQIDNTLETTPLDLADLIKSKLKELLTNTAKFSLPLRKKIIIKANISKILIEFEPATALIKAKQNKLAQKGVEKVLKDALKLAFYLEKNGAVDLFHQAKEITDLLDQLHQLLIK